MAKTLRNPVLLADQLSHDRLNLNYQNFNSILLRSATLVNVLVARLTTEILSRFVADIPAGNKRFKSATSGLQR